MLSKKTQYAFRALVHLAENYGKEPVKISSISIQQKIPLKFLEHILNDLKKEFGFTTVFISHDLGVVRYISDRIMVMNKGKIEEIGEAEQVYNFPTREYTKKLIESIPGTSIEK